MDCHCPLHNCLWVGSVFVQVVLGSFATDLYLPSVRIVLTVPFGFQETVT